MAASIDGQELFTCSCGVQVTTDLNGKLLYLSGIEEIPVHVTLHYNGQTFSGLVHPNEQVRPEEKQLVSIHQVAFDYPYQEGNHP